MPKPAELSAQLFDRLINVALGHAQGDLPDELEIKRLERDARAILRTHPEDAYQILGGIAALSLDLEALRKNHEASLRYGRSTQALANYATSLQLLGLYEDAASLMQEASSKEPENLSYLRSACSFTLWAGQLGRALELDRTLQKRDPDDKTERDGPLIERTLGMLEKHNATEREIQRALGYTFDFLLNRKVRFTHVSLAVDEDQDATFFTILIDRGVSEVMSLDTELGMELAENVPELSPSIVVELEPQPKKPAPRANVGSSARLP